MTDPKYRQIAEHLRMEIESGALGPGDRLPTETELQAKYGGASRSTVRGAIDLLSNRGLVSKQPGRGTFVLEKVTPLIVDLTPEVSRRVPGSSENVEYASAYQPSISEPGRQPSSSKPIVQMLEASAEIAALLGVQPGSPLISRHQDRYVGNVPFSLQTTYYPKSFADDGAERLMEARAIPEGGVPYLEKLLGFQEIGYEDRLTVRPAMEPESRFFDLASHVLIFETGRVSFDNTKTPIRYTVTVYPSDRNVFVIRAGDAPTADEVHMRSSDRSRKH